MKAPLKMEKLNGFNQEMYLLDNGKEQLKDLVSDQLELTYISFEDNGLFGFGYTHHNETNYCSNYYDGSFTKEQMINDIDEYIGKNNLGKYICDFDNQLEAILDLFTDFEQEIGLGMFGIDLTIEQAISIGEFFGIKYFVFKEAHTSKSDS